MSSETIVPSVATAVPLTTVGAGSVTNDVLTWDGTKWVSTAIPAQITYESLTGSTTLAAALTPAKDFNLCRGTTAVSWLAQIANNNAANNSNSKFSSALTSSGYAVGFVNRSAVTANNASGTAGASSIIETTQEAGVALYSKAGVVQWLTRCKSSGNTINNVVVTTDSSDNVYAAFNATNGTVTVYSSSGTAFGTTFAGTGGVFTVLVQYNALGVIQWATRIVAASGNVTNDLTQWNGNIYLVGTHSSALTAYNNGGLSGGTLLNAGGTDINIIKYNSSGTVQWVGRIAGTGADAGQSIAVNAFGVFVGFTYAAAPTIYNAGDVSSTVSLTLVGTVTGAIVKYDDNGTYQMNLKFDSTAGTVSNVNVALSSTRLHVVFNVTANANTYHSSGAKYKMLVNSSAVAVLARYTHLGECIDTFIATSAGFTARLLRANDFGVFLACNSSATGTFYNNDGTAYGTNLTITGAPTPCLANYYEGRVLWVNAFDGAGASGYLGDLSLDNTDIYLNCSYANNPMSVAMPYGSTASTVSLTFANDTFVTKLALAALFTAASPSTTKLKTITNDSLIAGTIMRITPSSSVTYQSKTYTSINLLRKGSSVKLMWNSSSWAVVDDFDAIYL